MNASIQNRSSWRQRVASGDFADEGILPILWRRRRTMLVTILVCVSGAAAYIRLATPQYLGLARLYVEPASSKVMPDPRPGTIRDALSSNYLQTQAALVSSIPVLTNALNSPGVRQMHLFTRVDDPLLYLQKNLQVDVGKKDDITSISITSADPQESAQLVNTIVDSYVAYQTGQKQSTAGQVLEILQRERAKYENQFKQQSQAAVTFKQANAILSFENDKGNVIVERLSRFSDALSNAQVERICAQATCAAAQELANRPERGQQLIQELSRSSATAFDSQYSELCKQFDREQVLYQAMMRVYGVDHPAVDQSNARIAELRDKIGQAQQIYATNYLASAREQLDAAQKKEAQLQHSFDEQQKLAMELNSKSAQYGAMLAELNRTEKVLDILDARIKEVNVGQDDGGMNIQVIERAHANVIPDTPQPIQATLIALLAGVVVGTGLSLGREATDRHFRGSRQIAAALEVPVLGSIARATIKGQTPGRQLTLMQPNSTFAQAVQSLQLNLRGRLTAKASRLLVCSPNDGEGKSLLAANLAIAMADAGQRVLLIDANLRTPTLHQFFNVLRDDLGICGVMAGHDVLSKAIRPTGVERLDLLPAGDIPANASQILQSRGFALILSKASQPYDRIVIDSPAANGPIDARLLAVQCDGVLVVMRYGATRLEDARQCCNNLLHSGAKVVGVVVNDVPRSCSANFGSESPAQGESPSSTAASSQATHGQEIVTDVAI